MTPCTPLDGSPAARWAAAPRFRTVPPIPTSLRPFDRLPRPGGVRELRRHALAKLLQLTALGGTVRGQEPLAHQHGPDAPGSGVASEAVPYSHELHRSAAEIKDAAVRDRAEFAAAR